MTRLGGRPLQVAGDLFLFGRELDVLAGRLRGDADRAAQLAVDLQHQLDLVGDQRGFVHVRPGASSRSPSSLA